MSDPSSSSSAPLAGPKSPESVALTREMAIASVAKAQSGEPVKSSSSSKSALKINEFAIHGRREVVDKHPQSDVAPAGRSSRSADRKTTSLADGNAVGKKKGDAKAAATAKKRRSRSRS